MAKEEVNIVKRLLWFELDVPLEGSLSGLGTILCKQCCPLKIGLPNQMMLCHREILQRTIKNFASLRNLLLLAQKLCVVQPHPGHRFHVVQSLLMEVVDYFVEICLLN